MSSLNVQRWGSGERACVLIHGFTGSSDSWCDVAPAFAEHRRLLAVDLPGHGRSPAPSRGFDQTVCALDEAIAPDAPVDLVGYSMGARIALAFAIEHPERVRRLVLESGSPGLADRREREQRMGEDEARATRLEREGLNAFVDDWERLPLFEGLRRTPWDVQRLLRDRRCTNTATGLAASLRHNGAGAQPSYWEQLASLGVPTLIVTGAKDLKFTDIGRRMAGALQRASQVILPDVWHVPHLEAPQAYARMVLSFLQTP